MTLTDEIKKATIEDLRKLNLLSLNIYYARNNHELLSFLYERQIIDDSSIEKALEEAVFNQARRDYQYMTTKKDFIVYADHVGMPECLAYALDKGKFSGKEIRQMHFDHGETAKTFSQNYGIENLLSTLKEELLNPKPLPNLECPLSECNCSL